MLNKQELGKAIGDAIKLKIATGAIKTQAEVAAHFNIKPPSISDWKAKGTIAKSRIPELFRYFSDVAGPKHWGLSEAEWPSGLSAPEKNSEDNPTSTNSVEQKTGEYNLWQADTQEERDLLAGFRAAGPERREDMLDAARKSLKTNQAAA